MVRCLFCQPEWLRAREIGAMDLTSRELATMLAALRFWQREGLTSAGCERVIATDEGTLEELSADEIDELCERLNVCS